MCVEVGVRNIRNIRRSRDDWTNARSPVDVRPPAADIDRLLVQMMWWYGAGNP